MSDTLNDNPKKDGFIRVFTDFLNKNEIAISIFKRIEFKEITLDDINDIINRIPIDVPNRGKIADAILIRYKYLKDF